jgi:flagellar motility protein MotE (MotC chaperone)
MKIFNIVACFLIVFYCVAGAENLSFDELKAIGDNLKQKEEILNKKERELAEKEKNLSNLEQELLKKEKELNEIRQKLETLYEKIKVTEDENLDKLAKVYGSTKAKSAASVIAKMELDKAVSLFQKMNPMAAGKIMLELAKVDPEFASKISERLTPTKDKLK